VKFTINEVSVVDRPANEHARVTLIKRADEVVTMDVSKIATLESTMDVLAEQYAKANGVDVPAAYSALMKSDEQFRELATDLQDARRDPREIQKLQRQVWLQKKVEKVAGTSAEGELETLAKKYAEDNCVPFVKAYNAVLDTAEGRALYKQHRDELIAAA
jgi:hypothetical protein